MKTEHYTPDETEQYILDLPHGSEVMINKKGLFFPEGFKMTKVCNARIKPHMFSQSIVVRVKTHKRHKTFTFKAEWFTCGSWIAYNKILNRTEVPF